jgi:hypothetical protein
MPLKLRPTGLDSAIDTDRQDYTVYTGGWDISWLDGADGRVFNADSETGLSASAS